MDWNMVGAIGEIGGAAAVVITLVYLARQTRANTKAVAGSSSREIWLALSNWNREIAGNPELRKIGFKSLQPVMQDYTAEEWHDFMAYSVAYFSILEAEWVNHDLNIGHEGVRLFEGAGFIHSCPAWRKAFDEWRAGGGIDEGLIAAIEQIKPKFPNLVTAQRGAG